MPYFSGQGRVKIAPRDSSGAIKAYRYPGNVPALAVDLKTDTQEHVESTTGQRLTDFRLTKQKSATVKFAIEEFTKENLALAFWGNSAIVTAGTVTGEALATGLAAGDYVALRNIKVSSIVIKDSAGTPATLTAGTHYRIDSADHGALQILNVGTFVQPFKVDYAYAGAINIPMFTTGLLDYAVRFEGLNTADTGTPNAPVVIELYRVQFDPSKTLDLINTELNKFEMEGMALIDPTKALDPSFGQFGRLVMLS